MEQPKKLQVHRMVLKMLLGWTYARLNEIVNARRGVSADSALAFADTFTWNLNSGLIYSATGTYGMLKVHKKIKPILKRAT